MCSRIHNSNSLPSCAAVLSNNNPSTLMPASHESFKSSAMCAEQLHSSNELICKLVFCPSSEYGELVLQRGPVQCDTIPMAVKAKAECIQNSFTFYISPSPANYLGFFREYPEKIVPYARSPLHPFQWSRWCHSCPYYTFHYVLIYERCRNMQYKSNHKTYSTKSVNLVKIIRALSQWCTINIMICKLCIRKVG